MLHWRELRERAYSLKPVVWPTHGMFDVFAAPFFLLKTKNKNSYHLFCLLVFKCWKSICMFLGANRQQPISLYKQPNSFLILFSDHISHKHKTGSTNRQQLKAAVGKLSSWNAALCEFWLQKYSVYIYIMLWFIILCGRVQRLMVRMLWLFKHLLQSHHEECTQPGVSAGWGKAAGKHSAVTRTALSCDAYPDNLKKPLNKFELFVCMWWTGVCVEWWERTCP